LLSIGQIFNIQKGTVQKTRYKSENSDVCIFYYSVYILYKVTLGIRIKIDKKKGIGINSERMFE